MSTNGSNGHTPAETEYGTITLLRSDGQTRSLKDIEAEVIKFAVAHYSGHKAHMSEVSRRLGIGRSTLYRKIDELPTEVAPGDIAGENENKTAPA